jgi:PDZ domain-containing protein
VPEVVDLIEIEGAPTYPVRGNMYMLTVAQQDLNIYEVAAGMADPTVDVIERVRVRPIGVSPEEYQRIAHRNMEEAKNTAIVVALSRLGYEVTYTGDGVEVATILEGTPAVDVLQVGDVIVAVDGSPVSIERDAITLIQSRQIGDTITLTVLRNGEKLDVEVTLIEHVEQKGRPMVGFGAVTHNLTYEFPIEVDIDSTNIGGPSAGFMYALTLMNLLTPEDLTKGHRIAGTGTIASDGTVGPIGGIRQKIEAAEAAGAEYVFVPADNWDEALTGTYDRIELVKVATLDDALEFLAQLAEA